MNSSSIIPECWADRLLVKTLGYTAENHQHSIGEVNNLMNKKFKNKIAIGLVDNDKKSQPSDFKKFKELETKHGLTLKRGPLGREKHYLIVVSPAIDMWLESVGNSVNVKRPYGKDYLKRMKSEDVGEDKLILNYFNTIRQKNPPHFKTIQNWVSLIFKGTFK